MSIENSIRDILQKLRTISDMGFVPAVGSGSNSIGKTLQALLGIEHGVKTRNTLKGFTVTASSSASRKTNLFACVPDWEKSHFNSTTEFVRAYGLEDKGRGYKAAIFCTVDGVRPNSTFRLKLHVEKPHKRLHEVHFDKDGTEKRILTWSDEKLDNKIKSLGNHAIVSAIRSKTGSGEPSFHFRYVDFLVGPDPYKFYELIDEGGITVDHLISLRDGESSAIEKGPLFKINKEARPSLFSEIYRYDLMG